MTSKAQVIAAWMTAVMLLAQVVCPGLALGCGCQNITPSSPATEQVCRCCCSSGSDSLASGSCPHCNPASESDDSSESDTADDQFHRHFTCHCGDLVPVLPAEEGIPDSSESLLGQVLGQFASIDWCLRTKVIVAPIPVPPPVLSSEELTHNYTQVVLCVWLT